MDGPRGLGARLLHRVQALRPALLGGVPHPAASPALHRAFACSLAALRLAAALASWLFAAALASLLFAAAALGCGRSAAGRPALLGEVLCLSTVAARLLGVWIS